MQKFKLKLEQRENKKPNQLRREHKVPVTVYGPGKPSVSAQVCAHEFSRLPAAAYSHIIDLDLGGQGVLPAIIRDVQRKSTTGAVLNVQFYRTAADRKLSVTVPLKFTGSSPAVHQGGQLVEVYQEADIECFPQDIPDYLEVDISTIVEIDHGIHFGELKVPSTIKILNPHEEIVVRVVAKRASVEKAPGAETAAAAAPAAT